MNRIVLILMCMVMCQVTINSYAKGNQSHRQQLNTELRKKQVEISQKKRDINRLEKEVSKYDDEIIKYTSKLDVGNQELQKQRDNFRGMVLRVYKNNEVQFLSQLLTSSSVSQFFNRIQIIHLMLREQQNILTKYQQAKTEIEEAIKKINQAKEKQKPLLLAANKEMQGIEKELRDIYRRIEALSPKEDEYRGSYGSGEFYFPTPGGKLSNNYHCWRGRHHHKGVDIRNYLGAPICAADSGVVSFMKANPGGYGYYIKVKHDNGLTTLYAHMYRSTVTVHLGQRVKKGQVIARVGLNGRTSGPHLHFEVHKNQKEVNPVRFLA